MSAREPGPLRDVPLERFFHPRTVAVVGASANRANPGNLLYRTVRRKVEGEGGVVHAVNPNRDEIEGRPCYHRLEDIPGHLDLVVIASGNAVDTLREVVARRPTFVMMFAAGFAEAGEDGARDQEEVRRLVAEHGVFLLGPNTTLNSFLPLDEQLPGPRIALVSHSGHQGRHLWQGHEVGVPLGYWAPTGNEVDLEYADFVKWYADQPEIGAIAGYIEGFKDGATVLRSADHALAQGTPIVLVKVGRSAMGVSNAMSHTAHLAGSDAVTSAVFRQYGISRVDTLDELLHTAGFLARAAAPLASGVCLYSISGGTLAHLSDLMATAGLTLPELAPATQAQLRGWIPDRMRVSNPVDSGGAPSGDERGRQILEALIADPAVGVVVVPFVANAYHLSDAVARDVVAVAATSPKPVCVVWGSPGGLEATYRDVLVPSGVPVFRTFGQCTTALRSWFDHHAVRTRYVSPFSPAPAPALTPVRALPAPGVLSEVDAKVLLHAYGVGVTRDVLVHDAEGARRAAVELGPPVVMKISSADIPHKSDLGLVVVGVPDGDGAAATYDTLVARAVAAVPGARLDGVLVSELVAGGVETVLGVARDEVFGPVVMFGLGGVLVEVLEDVTFRVPPFGPEEARRMIGELRGARVLEGVRGRPAASIDALVEAIMAVQQLVLDHGDRLVEVDVNPLLALPDRVVALDALVAIRAAV